MKIKKLFSINKISGFFFLLSLYFSFAIGELFFLSTNSPDFFVYSQYFDYFAGEIKVTNREQGLLYFYLNYIVLFLKSEYINELNMDLIIHSSIQYTNFILYTIGLYGIFKLLKVLNFKVSNIFISLILLNFFPVALMLRWTFKPEILVFSLLPWVLYYLELFFIHEETKYLYILSFPLSIIMTSKGPVIAMVGILMLIYFIKIIKKGSYKKIYKPLILFITIFVLITLENFEANRRLFYDYQDLDPGIFNNPADVNIIYNINFYELFFAPFRHYHFDSLPGIILLDTYGDYFFWYFDNDKSLFGINTINLLEKLPFINKYSTSLYQSQLLSLFFSIITYTFLIYYAIKYKRYRTYLLLPLIGLIVLTLQALGLSSFLIDKNINFDKSTSDIFKMFYLGFLINISFIILYNILLQKFKNLSKIMFTIIYIASMLVVYGFPVDKNLELTKYLEEKNNISHMCNINSSIFQLSSENCNDPAYQFCIPNDRYINNDYIQNRIPKISSGEFKKRIIRHKNSSNEVLVDNFIDCMDTVEPLKLSSIKDNTLNNMPYINLIYFFIFLYFIFFYSFKSKTIKIRK